MSNDHALRLAKFDGSANILYATGYQLYFQGWAPDSVRFVYDQFSVHQPFLGTVCGRWIYGPLTYLTWIYAMR